VTDEMIGTMGAEEALAAAAAEGLTLWRSNNVSGYRAVYHQKNVNAANGGIFEVRTKEGDNMISHHGYFRTAEHAALVFARYVRDERGEAGETRLSEGLGGLPQPEMMMGAEEALAAAEAEGLVLERTDARADGSGFIGVRKPTRAWERNGIPAGIVRVHGDRYSRPFEASLQFNAKTTHLAWCATAEQAALLRARALRDAKAALAAERAAAAAEAGEDEEETEGMLTAEEALAKAEAEGLAFARSEKAKSGYKNVYIIDTSSYSNKNAPYHVAFNGKNLGFYESLEHAALVAARYVAAGGFRPGARGRPDPVLLDGPRGAAVNTTPRKPPKDREAAASAQASASASEAGSGKRKRAPNKVPSMSNMERLLGGGGETSAAAAAEAEPEGLEGIPTHDASGRPLSEYERQRLANIRSNERQLTAMLAAAEHAAEAAADEEDDESEEEQEVVEDAD
jgi:hypothetical protein